MVLVWGVYILEHLWNTTYCKTPPRYKQSMVNCGTYFIIILGGLLMDLCHPDISQMVKTEMCVIEFQMMTAIFTTGYTCGWEGNRQCWWKSQSLTVLMVKNPFSWREKKWHKGWKRWNNANSNSSIWMILQTWNNFFFNTLKIKIKSNQTVDGQEDR